MDSLIILYYIAAGLLALYGLNCHLLIHLFKRQVDRQTAADRQLLESFYTSLPAERLPVVTTQIPIFNELNVAERIIDAVARFDYPPGRHEIQVLDDSTDETSGMVAAKVEALKAKGVSIEHIRRIHRQGFKAGALKSGMKTARGEFLAIFDADFLPPPDFLLKTVPFFIMEPTVGLVQGRWGHLNADQNLLTRLQAVGINGHFVVEQSARNWNGLFMNFNGTAGVFRKQAILDAGGWHSDTLTEDLDLSYRMQLVGWECRYLVDVVAPAEIPTEINALKNQQFRWAKGSIQTAVKLLPRVWHSRHPLFKKVQATLHMTHYLVHPLMIFLAVMSTPLLLSQGVEVSFAVFTGLGFIFLMSTTGPSRLYITAERHLTGWTRRLLLLPFMVCLGCGMALNNSRAVLEGLWSRQGEFIRTPKQGHIQKIRYRAAASRLFLLEILLGFWCILGVYLYFEAQQHFIGYFLILYAVGFLFVGFTSLRSQLDHSQTPPQPLPQPPRSRQHDASPTRPHP